MKFVSVRDLRGQPRKVWRELRKSRELVITSNGKPIGILSHTSEDEFEQTIADVRRVRAARALAAIQQRSVELGTDRLTLDDINREIAAARRERKR